MPLIEIGRFLGAHQLSLLHFAKSHVEAAMFNPNLITIDIDAGLP